MDILTNRKYKKRAKLFYRLAFVSVGLVFLNFFLFAFNAFDMNKENFAIKIIIIASLITPMFFALFFWLFAMINSEKFMKHHRKVKQWRLHNIVSKIIKFETTDKHDKAIELYNTLKTSSDKDMLFTFIIANSMHSDDPKRKEKAIQKFKMYRDWYKPNKIDFN